MDRLDSLEADTLTCVRGGRLVFRNVSFRLEAGEALAVEGPNGAGKSSLLRMLAGFFEPAAGVIRLANTKHGEQRGRWIGWLGHQDAIKSQLTVRETLRFFARLYGAERKDGYESAFRDFGLNRLLDLPCQYLSAGQKKRAALARLKLMRRPLWLMDEPLAALDAQAKALCAQLIETHCAGGGMVIAATHEPLGLDASHLTLGGA